MQKDSVLRTLAVATLLCVVCSFLVSGSAVALKDKQEANKKFDIKKNLLLASGLIKSKKASREEVDQAYEKIQAQVIDLETGEVVPDMDPQEFDQVKARKTAGKNKEIASDQDLAGIKVRSKYSVAYKYIEDGVLRMLILPINGKGLWSTLYGFLALEPDLQTIKGVGFYQHGETPGLGGEIENPNWQAQWEGKKAYNEDFSEVEFKVIKGSVDPSKEGSQYHVDGLSGATITSNGVTGLVRYWLGSDGFGTYLSSLRSGTSLEQEAAELSEEDSAAEVPSENSQEPDTDEVQTEEALGTDPMGEAGGGNNE